MTTKTTFTREFGTFTNGGGGHTLVLASAGYADILVQTDYANGGYSLFRRGDADVVSNHRTQRDAKAAALAALATDREASDLTDNRSR